MNKIIITAVAALSTSYSMDIPFELTPAGNSISKDTRVIVVKNIMNYHHDLQSIAFTIVGTLMDPNYPGLLGREFKMSRTPSMLTVWTDRNSMMAFEHSTAHGAAREAFKGKKNELGLTVTVTEMTLNTFLESQSQN